MTPCHRQATPVRRLTTLLGLAAALTGTAGAADRILIYTRNHTPDGKGYVHDNIAASVAAFQAIAKAEGLEADVSSNAAVFATETLKAYKALVFANSNNEAFADDAQRAAFEAYIRGGGGLFGLHSATGSERKNDFFKSALGGRFRWHTPAQPFTLKVTDKTHPSTAHLKDTWAWKDEGYICDLAPGLHVLLEMDLTTIKKPARDKFPAKIEGDTYPLAWCQSLHGGRQFYTALGHFIPDYQRDDFRQHLRGGLLWVLGRAPAAKP